MPAYPLLQGYLLLVLNLASYLHKQQTEEEVRRQDAEDQRDEGQARREQEETRKEAARSKQTTQGRSVAKATHGAAAGQLIQQGNEQTVTPQAEAERETQAEAQPRQQENDTQENVAAMTKAQGAHREAESPMTQQPTDAEDGSGAIHGPVYTEIDMETEKHDEEEDCTETDQESTPQAKANIEGNKAEEQDGSQAHDKAVRQQACLGDSQPEQADATVAPDPTSTRAGQQDGDEYTEKEKNRESQTRDRVNSILNGLSSTLKECTAIDDEHIK